VEEISLLIGGKAGFGIDKAGMVIAGILSRLNYRIYIYRDYPSLIRGGHTFSIIRAGKKKAAAHFNKVDFILALNQETFDLHRDRLNPNGIVIFDLDSVKAENLQSGAGVPIEKIMKEEAASEIMRNSCIIGAFVKAAGIEWDILKSVFDAEMDKDAQANLKIARRGYDEVQQSLRIEPLSGSPLPFITGNEALSQGLIKAGLGAYVAYPMTPSSGILHYMASTADKSGVMALHLESEISVIIAALGFAYAGKKAAVGTSGGGFCLMTEGLSFSGMSELPVVIVMGQRTGPSTGLPTYTGQAELDFVIAAGHGEFPRLVVAPGDCEEAYFWAGAALNLAWQFQIPAIILTDKTIAEGVASFDLEAAGEVKEKSFPLWDKKGIYKRYALSGNGVSPLAFAPEKDAVIKVSSYEHDEVGITIESAEVTRAMQEKRLGKEKYLLSALDVYEAVKVYGDKNAGQALLCWGSNKGVCREVAEQLKLKVIQPLVLWPFPLKQFEAALTGVTRLIVVENNATGQLKGLLKRYGIETDEQILKYDGRPFTIDELTEDVRKVI
jgi:2-oxoglutarate ferredoxin oxidoreductase subunit alpha